MEHVIRALIGISALAFATAVTGSLWAGEIAGAPPEAFSRAASYLVLLAIALAVSEGRAARAAS